MTDSLAARVAARREQRVASRSAKFILPIPGYKDLLAARYKPLSFEQKRKIQLRHDGIGEDADDEVAASADLLINACVEVLEITGSTETGEPSYETISGGWSAGVIASTFGLDIAPQMTARAALIMALGSDDVMEHFGQYAQAADAILADGEEAAQGEAKPSEEG